ncbi:MAG: hypothetical protein ACJAS1_001606 [Oleiphilaceae bacterium]|jgi:hypothetical protein
MNRLPNVKQPCNMCPFRKDSLEGWLGEDRMTEICSSESFVCHKNNDLQCAGHMLLKDQDNSFVRLASRLNMDTGLNGRELVFDTEDDCIGHHA